MYKEIILNYNDPFSDSELMAIKIFNKSFDEAEIKLGINNNDLIILLREIDINKFYDTCNKLSVYSNKNLFNDIVKAVNSIKSYGIKNKKRNYVDYNKERKVKERAKKEEKRGQYYYARTNKFSKKNNEIPKEYENKIICGDSLDILRRLPDNCIDLIFTSPPYNFGLDYENNQDDKYWEDYFKKLFDIFEETIRILKWGGRIIVNIQPLFSDYIPSHHIVSNFFLKRKMIWKGEIIWEKNNYNCKYTAWGSWKSPSSPYLKYTWEFLEIYAKGSLKKAGEKENIDITANEFKEWVVAKWSIAPERDMRKFGHPAMFPEKLAERVIKLFSFKKDIILDPFNGVGTTTYVARKLDRRYLGIDISQEYCDIANIRLNTIKKGLFDGLDC